MAQNTSPHRPVLRQAPVRALDPDGLAVVTAGTAIFAASILACWATADYLIATDRIWYLYVAITGTAVGLIGLAVGLVRRHRWPTEQSVEETFINIDRVPDRG